MMQSRMRVSKKIEDLDVSLEITMKLSEWREFENKLVDGWPSWKVGEIIQQAIRDIHRATDRITDYPPEMTPP